MLAGEIDDNASLCGKQQDGTIVSHVLPSVQSKDEK